MKTATPTTYNAVGNVISYSYLVTNTGNVTLTDAITVTDDKTTVTCGTTLLAPGGTITCTASYTITQADLDADSVTNVATAHSGPVTSNTDDETVTAIQVETVLLVKTATPTTYNAVGDVISYSYAVTNTGNVTLPGPTSVTDDKIPTASISCPATDLAPTQTVTCTGTYTITLADLNAGTVVNVAHATVDEIDSNEDTETVTAGQAPNVQLEKTGTFVDASPAGVNAGDTITYAFTVTNTGNVTLSNITITDPNATISGGPLA